MKTRWKTLGHEVFIPDLDEWVRAAVRDGREVHIGTDSLQTGRWTQYVSVVVILSKGKGGRVAYSREVVPRNNSLRERLLKEVWRSTELGLALTDALGGSRLTIHVDANPDEKHMSSKYVQELVGLVVGQGFTALIKPEAWAATHAADHVVRRHGRMPYGYIKDMPTLQRIKAAR